MASHPPTPLPLLRPPLAPSPLVWAEGRTIDRRRFLADARRVAARLPSRAFVLNLCEGRYPFLVAFAAALVRGQVTLLPASRLEPEIADVAARYLDSHRLFDADVLAWRGGDREDGEPVSAVPMVDAHRIAAIAFTSGSTGRSQPHAKSWGELVAGAGLAERRFLTGPLAQASLVATPPPQHMYGLETSVMLPLRTGASVSDARPFFPADIHAALARVPPPRVLVTTPAHLRVAVESGLAWPKVDLVISATAPLARELAAEAERALASPVMEIFGFTEAGSVASRRTLAGDEWTLYDGFRIVGDRLVGQHLSTPVPFPDVIEPRGETGFVWIGRKQDMVNIAGKRTSLAYLDQQLLAIAGVTDGVFLPPAEGGTRLSALAVAPGMAKDGVLAELRRRLDPLFLPRPLLLIDALPRNESGKLRRDDLRRLLEGLGLPPRPDDGP